MLCQMATRTVHDQCQEGLIKNIKLQSGGIGNPRRKIMDQLQFEPNTFCSLYRQILLPQSYQTSYQNPIAVEQKTNTCTCSYNAALVYRHQSLIAAVFLSLAFGTRKFYPTQPDCEELTKFACTCILAVPVHTGYTLYIYICTCTVYVYMCIHHWYIIDVVLQYIWRFSISLSITTLFAFHRLLDMRALSMYAVHECCPTAVVAMETNGQHKT